MRLGQQASIVIQRDKQGHVIARMPGTDVVAHGATARDAMQRLDGRIHLP